MTHPRRTRLRLPLVVRIAGTLLALGLWGVASFAVVFKNPYGDGWQLGSAACCLGGAVALGAFVLWFLSLPLRRGDDA